MRRLGPIVVVLVTVAAGLGIGHRGLPAAAQAEPASLADHPLVGVWLVMNPEPGFVTFAADGSVSQEFPAVQVGEVGAEFVSSGIGVWEPIGERTGHFTAVHLRSDAAGSFLGSVAIEGHLDVSEDGQRWVEDWSDGSTVTMRDAANGIVAVVGDPGFEPIVGVRMAPDDPGFPGSDGTPTATE